MSVGNMENVKQSELGWWQVEPPGNLMLILKIEKWEHRAFVIHPLFARSKVSQLFIQWNYTCSPKIQCDHAQILLWSFSNRRGNIFMTKTYLCWRSFLWSPTMVTPVSSNFNISQFITLNFSPIRTLIYIAAADCFLKPKNSTYHVPCPI